MKGHAGFAYEGQDIVCAAVTSVCDLTIHLCEEYFKIETDLNVQGNGELEFTAKSEYELADKLLSGLCDYIETVKHDYPKCISIKFLEV